MPGRNSLAPFVASVPFVPSVSNAPQTFLPMAFIVPSMDVPGWFRRLIEAATDTIDVAIDYAVADRRRALYGGISSINRCRVIFTASNTGQLSVVNGPPMMQSFLTMPGVFRGLFLAHCKASGRVTINRAPFV